MPLIIKDHTWCQTEELVVIKVPLKDDTPAAKMNIFISADYVKVHSGGWLWEAVLWAPVDEEASKCLVGGRQAVFELAKKQSGSWDQLVKPLDKRQALEVKQQALEQAHRAHSQRTAAKKEKRGVMQREAVDAAMKLQTGEQKRIQDAKEELKERARREVEEHRALQLAVSLSPKASIKAIDKRHAGLVRVRKEAEVKKAIQGPPEPRQSARIRVDFTPRAFPTPCRESLLEQENQWLKKQVEVRRATGFMAEDLRPEENDPQWLLDKGLSLHSTGNYKGAISAFSHGLKLCKNMAELYVARSCSQLAMTNYRRVIQDCVQAQELLRPHVEANAEMRFTCHWNCGQAVVALGLPKKALGELQAALNIKPDHKACADLLDKAEDASSGEDEPPGRSYYEPEDLE